MESDAPVMTRVERRAKARAKARAELKEILAELERASIEGDILRARTEASDRRFLRSAGAL
jgi:hypothetical protein